MQLPRPDVSLVPADDGVELTCYTFGEGKPVLLVNGLGPSWHVWRRQLAHLSGRYRFITWDYRGMFDGEPVLAERSVERHAQDGLAVLDHIGVERAAVMAWSMGVQVALEMFRAAPQRLSLMVLIGGAARANWDGAGAGLRRIYPRLLELGGKAPRMLELCLRAALGSPEAYAWGRRVGLLGGEMGQPAFSDMAKSLARVNMLAYLEGLRAMFQHDASDILPQLDVPTLVIAGDRDPFTSRACMERLAQGISGSEYVLLPGATHFLILDQAELLNLRIDKFFNERGYGAPAAAS